MPYGTFTGILGSTDDTGGTVGVTKSTRASSQMNATETPDATTSANIITRGTPPSFIVTSPGLSIQNVLWSTSSEFAAEPTSTVIIASNRVNAAVTPDVTTSAETITLGSSSRFVVATTPRPIVSTGYDQVLAPSPQNRQAPCDSPSWLLLQ